MLKLVLSIPAASRKWCRNCAKQLRTTDTENTETARKLQGPLHYYLDAVGWYATSVFFLRVSVVRFYILPSDFRDGLPCTGRQLLAKRVLDQRHEDRPLGAGDVGAEDVATVDRENARAVDLSRESEL